MSRIPANYKDPSPGHMGWGRKELQPLQNLAVEEVAADENPIVGSVRDATGASSMPSIIEETLRKKMSFDAGWSFFPAMDLLYGTSGGLMLAQNMGNCVGNSHTCLLAARIAHEVYGIGQLEEPLGSGSLASPFIPYSYGVGRFEAGIRGNGDGSTCQGQISGTMKHGFLPCYIPGLDRYLGSLPQCSSSVGKKFGRSGSEFRKWEDHAAKFDLNEAPRVRTADDAWEAIVDKKMPLQICSGQGFKYHRNDSKYGELYRFGGSWGHSMQITMAMEFKQSRFFTITNQWGRNAHTGNSKMGAPRGSMVIPFDLFERWVNGGRRAHCVAIGEIEGLKIDLNF